MWGPAVGNTIYPDLQPTVEAVIIDENHSDADGFFDESQANGDSSVMIDSATIPGTESVIPITPPVTTPVQPLTIPIESTPVTPYPDVVPPPQSRFTPINDPFQVKQTSFPAVTPAAMTKPTKWDAKPWKNTESTARTKYSPKPMRIGENSGPLSSE